VVDEYAFAGLKGRAGGKGSQRRDFQMMQLSNLPFDDFLVCCSAKEKASSNSMRSRMLPICYILGLKPE
jgi:hypothetical protein